MNEETRTLMRDWLVRLYTKMHGDTFPAGEWAGQKVHDCIHGLNDDELQEDWRSYQC